MYSDTANPAQPRCGAGFNLLGLSPRDVQPDASGFVAPISGGMSVSGPGRFDMPPFLIPQRLRTHVPAAMGNSELKIWRMSDAPFADHKVSKDLALRLTSKKHGQIEPTQPKLKTDVLSDLCTTKPTWILDEP